MLSPRDRAAGEQRDPPEERSPSPKDRCQEDCPGQLGDFFAPRKRGSAQRPKGCSPALQPAVGPCGLCGGDVEHAALRELGPSEDRADEAGMEWLCRACRRRELAWARVRCWVCLHALVAEGRALPLVQASERPEPCASWEEAGAAERAMLLAAAPEGGRRGGGAALGALVAGVVRLPADLLARVLAFVHAGVEEVFAPSRAAPAKRPKDPKRHSCCQFLLTQGSCLHGRVRSGGCRRSPARFVACWYCPQTFPLETGVADLQRHGDSEHTADIAAWLRKKRKAKAREQRAWFNASPLGQAQRMMQYERQAGRGR